MTRSLPLSVLTAYSWSPQYASPNFGPELFLDCFDERPVYRVNFFIAQGAVIGAILDAQGHGTLAIGYARAFINADKLRGDTMQNPLVLHPT